MQCIVIIAFVSISSFYFNAIALGFFQGNRIKIIPLGGVLAFHPAVFPAGARATRPHLLNAAEIAAFRR
jgi:hypothetical protein